ncbi:response regulator PleD [Clostridium puniceum]|uniref:Response regulator PleD n=1 Tax=Clostridium puniceum TaxID=29367 RepID=A0A1S8T3I6_9CLOT|nr:GGDEF domain-containing protein [Clostridium puniceum]OOM72242.1 response regulator PleD [Clostridium puniceum]
MKITFKTVLPYITYIFILLGCYFLIKKLPSFTPPVILIVKYSSYIIFGLGLILSIRFNKGRVFLMILLLTLFELLLNYYLELSIDTTIYSKVLYPMMCILLPLNIVAFSQLKEKGIFSSWGKIRIFLMLIEMFAIYRFTLLNNPLMQDLLNYEFINLPLENIIMNQTALLIFFLTLLFFIIKAYVKNSVFEVRLIGIIISIFAALFFVNDRLSFSIFLSATGLVLITSIIEDSYSMAYLDELTEIPSRRALREDLMKLGTKYVIAMIDIDFFKKFNDKYGHDVGDDVLKLVASNLVKITGGGKAFRYGGEEFTIIFPGKSIDDAIPHLETLREQVSKSGYTKKSSKAQISKAKQGSSSQLFVTISIGVCEKSIKFKEIDEVMKGADKALYRAKKKGRNCVSK